LETNTSEHGALVDEIYSDYADQEPKQGALIPMLQDIQARLGYLPSDAINRVAQLLHVSPSQVYGVATFYHQFRLRPRGAHTITVCRGTACHVKGSLDTYNYIAQQLDIKPPQDTSSDGAFTIQQVRCLGACGLAPVMKVDETVYGRVDHKRIKAIIKSVREGDGKR
jgi:NADH-quinone oxidoreductase E subunit